MQKYSVKPLSNIAKIGLEKLDAVNLDKLKSVEKVWYTMLKATLTADSETYQKTLSDGLIANPESALLNWLSRDAFKFEDNKEFADMNKMNEAENAGLKEETDSIDPYWVTQQCMSANGTLGRSA